MLTLIKPTKEIKEKALAFRQEFFDCGERVIDGSEMFDIKGTYEEWLEFVTVISNLKEPLPKSVHTDTFFALDETGKIVGIIDLRYELNDFFKDFGHCGYSVRPSERRKGYATEMLGRVCEIAKEYGLPIIQLCALRTNIPSVKTIQKSGGVLTRSFDFSGQTADVYEIRL